ncbi:hypothetical protein BJV74DRAFT_889995 [Russula compacta]|nr:hypothetical protein BJV74DRAFT_889995 [Russula compacta]
MSVDVYEKFSGRHFDENGKLATGKFQADCLSDIYERIAFSIRRLLDEKAALRSRLEELERENASAQWIRARGRGRGSGSSAEVEDPQNLDLDEEARRSVERLSSRQTGTLRLHICEPFGLEFLYDPILLESPEATYIVEWCELKASHITKAYIASAKEWHTELHTIAYAPRGGASPLSLARDAVGVVTAAFVARNPLHRTIGIISASNVGAQRVDANRSSQDASPANISRGLKQGQIEQLTIELQQVSLTQPNAAESVLMKKLRE